MIINASSISATADITKLSMDNAKPADNRDALIAVMSICESPPEQQPGTYPIYPSPSQPTVNDTDKTNPHGFVLCALIKIQLYTIYMVTTSIVIILLKLNKGKAT